MLAEIERVLEAWTQRVLADPLVPSARRLAVAQIENHTATLLADVAQMLSFVEAAHGGSSQDVRDGTVIQRIVGERHGRQRARHGFTVAEVRREYVLLREEVAAAVRRAAARAPDEAGPVDEALAILARFVTLAEAASVEAMQSSAEAEGRALESREP